MKNNISAGQGIQSIEKASVILEKVKNSSKPVTLTELAKRTDISKNNLKKYLISFIRTGFLVFDETNKTYSLGPKLISLGLTALNNVDIFSFIDAYIVNLKNKLNKSVAVAIWADNGPIISKYQRSDNPVNINIEIGYAPPLLLSSVGKCFAAFSPAEIIEETVEKEIQEHHLNKKHIEEELKTISEKGYAFRDKEYEHIPGNRSIAAPVFDYSGTISAVISVLGFTDDLSVTEESTDVQTLKSITKEASFTSI